MHLATVCCLCSALAAHPAFTVSWLLHSVCPMITRTLGCRYQSVCPFRPELHDHAKDFLYLLIAFRRSQWPRGLRCRSSAARLLRLWVRIPPKAWMFVCCECCVLSGRGLCDGLITRLEESYRLWCVVVCDEETSKTRRLKPATGL